ncbi:MAG: VWA domain-containing protein, partial [Chloroflexi bacterium]|nr:VWA domain-containing protein [Chloroflexota bacterium]
MGIAFSNPGLLLLLVPLLGLTLLLSLAARHHIARGRRRFGLMVRMVVLSTIVLALAGLQVTLPVDRLTSVFVVDLSDSVGADGRQEAVTFVREALEEMPDGDRAGIVAFGDEALVERLPSDVQALERIASVVTGDATDIGSALRLAAALFPDETQKRIVLVSDGNDTTGGGESEAALAAARGIQVETRAVGLGDADEVIVERLDTPTTARVGEEIEAEVTIRSTVRQPATVRLFGDGVSIAAEQVTLEAGTNRFVFTTRATEAGFHTFRALVEAGRDTFGQNN